MPAIEAVKLDTAYIPTTALKQLVAHITHLLHAHKPVRIVSDKPGEMTYAERIQAPRATKTHEAKDATEVV